MDHTTFVDTSLYLNTSPLQLLTETPKQEMQSNFIDFGMKTVSVKQESSGALVEELKRVSAENKKLTEMLTVMCENYNALRSRSNLMEHMDKNPQPTTTPTTSTISRKRKISTTNSSCMINSSTVNNDQAAAAAAAAGFVINGNNSESCSSEENNSFAEFKPIEEEMIKAKISRVHVQSEASDTTSLVVKDGYQWRKYGQKVTRDNPSPRAYFKCSLAPTCPVKKKVQRSIEDQSILVATYEGEHNHPHPSKVEANSSSNRCAALGSVPRSTSLGSSGPAVTPDLTKSKSNQDANRSSVRRIESPEFQQFLIDQMASSLTKDPSFKAALAAAISGKIIQHNQTENW